VSEDLNGTVVNCTDVTTSDTVSTMINVIIGKNMHDFSIITLILSVFFT
jgi:hypothetical protein